MNKNFMIGFLHEGYFYCANVHRYYHDSKTVYLVTVLTNKSRPDLPSSITLEENDKGITQVSMATVPPAFLETIVAEINKHEKKIH